MKEDFTEITMYECKFCGLLFRTNERHFCKFNPRYHNCFSCQRFHGIEMRPITTESELAGEKIEETYPAKFISCKETGGVRIADFANRNWNLNCPYWKELNNYNGKTSYLRKLQSLSTKPRKSLASSACVSSVHAEDLPF